MTSVTISMDNEGQTKLSMDSDTGVSGIDLINMFLSSAYAIADDNGMNSHESHELIAEMNDYLGED